MAVFEIAGIERRGRLARAFGVRSVADGIGILGSAVCALHCIAAPALLVVGTTVPVSFVADEAFHEWLLWAILSAGALAFGLGCWHHKDRSVLLLGILGLMGLSASAGAPHHLVGELGERVTTLGSASLLVAAHYRNFKLCRADGCRHEDVPG